MQEHDQTANLDEAHHVAEDVEPNGQEMVECHLGPIVLAASNQVQVEHSRKLVDMVTKGDEVVLLQALHVVSSVDARKVGVHVFHVVLPAATHHEGQVFSLAQDRVPVQVDNDEIYKLIALLRCFVGLYFP